jgi:YbbR domain-containing protein
MTSRLTIAISTLRTWTVTNWPTKLTALVLAAILWAAVASQEPTTQLVPVRLEVQPPEGRALAAEFPQVQALFAGRSRELIKLYARPPVVTKVVPDTVSGSRYTIELSSRDLQVADGIDVTATAIEPRIVQVQLDDVAEHQISVVPRVSVAPDSGYAQFGGIVVEPDSILIRGPEALVERTASIRTQVLALPDLRGPVSRTVPLDTAPLAGLFLSHSAVTITVDVAPVSQTVLNGVPVRVTATRTGSWVSDPLAVILTVSGRASRLARITADSVRVVARVTGNAAVDTVSLSVTPPAGMTAFADPAFVTVRRRTP